MREGSYRQSLTTKTRVKLEPEIEIDYDELNQLQDIVKTTTKLVEDLISPKVPVREGTLTSESGSVQAQNIIEIEQTPYSHSGLVRLQWQSQSIYLLAQALLTKQGFACKGQKIPIDSVAKVTVYSESIRGDTYTLKISHSLRKEVMLGLERKKDTSQHYLWFSKMVNARLINLGVDPCCQDRPKEQSLKIYPDAMAEGEIWKRSKFRGAWERRHVVINQSGLFSYRDVADDPTFSISIGTISAIWTRFHNHKGCIIVKIRHRAQKTQIAIPLCDFTVPDKQNWLWVLYQLMFLGIRNKK